MGEPDKTPWVGPALLVITLMAILLLGVYIASSWAR